jgi:DNA primase
VAFPFVDRDGRLVAVQTRAIDPEPVGSAHWSGGEKASGVFATGPAAFSSPVVAVVEAPIDALTLEACGLPAVATGGTAWPGWLLTSLSGRRVLVAFDGDAAGEEASRRLAAELSSFGLSGERLRPLAAKDWADLAARHGIDSLRRALSASTARGPCDSGAGAGDGARTSGSPVRGNAGDTEVCNLRRRKK